MKMNKDRLTTSDYWSQKYFSDNKVHIVNPNINLATKEVDKLFKKYLPQNNKLKFIEIGCAPGQWLGYFHNIFGYQVDGIEYTESGVRQTQENLTLQNIKTTIYNQDLFTNTIPKESYDVVFSSGFIEHFTDPKIAIKKHVELLKRGGLLILKIPNVQGYNLKLQKILDNDIVIKHNLEIMNLPYFRELEKTFKLKLLSLTYTGKINFGLFIGNKIALFFLYGLQFLLTIIYNFTGISLPNNPKYSPYIIGIYQK